MIRRPVICGRMMKVVGDAADSYFTDLRDGQVFEDEVIALLSRTVGEDWVSIDVGANIGLESLALAVLAPRGRVHAFEPVPRTVEHLRQNVEANARDTVEVHAMAVGSQVTELEFFENPEFAAGSYALDKASPLLRELLSTRRPADALIRVPCTTLDQFASAHGLSRLDLVKIDAEGFDLDVLAGAGDVLARFRPCVIMEFASYALSVHRSMLPADALAIVRRTFDRVFVLGGDGGRPREIATDADACDLLYDNANHHPVQDLFCAFDGSAGLEAALSGERMRDRVVALERQVAELRQTIGTVIAERELIEHSLSWRITSPLRRLRAMGRHTTRRARG
jgi:FkbM family methyltransferase